MDGQLRRRRTPGRHGRARLDPVSPDDRLHRPAGDRALSHPGAFLDRDGVLIEDSGYPHRDEDLKLIPGAAVAVRRLNAAGYRTVIVTNQSGVARGLFDEDRMHAFLQRPADGAAGERGRADRRRLRLSVPRRRRGRALPPSRPSRPQAQSRHDPARRGRA
ncbi:HAD-IIIA family hydrolase [Brevundimonas albigilva]|uniref:HAD-IIIA family hydrolase n=1 Tax=Brevundimonas albigilva TaxID=1312364 RepID=UPI003D315AF6